LFFSGFAREINLYNAGGTETNEDHTGADQFPAGIQEDTQKTEQGK